MDIVPTKSKYIHLKGRIYRGGKPINSFLRNYPTTIKDIFLNIVNRDISAHELEKFAAMFRHNGALLQLNNLLSGEINNLHSKEHSYICVSRLNCFIESLKQSNNEYESFMNWALK